MLRSILLAKLLVMLYVNYSVIVAGDDIDSNPRQLVLSLPQVQIDRPDQDCVVIIVSGLPRTRSGILSLFAEDSEGVREVFKFVAGVKQIRDEHLQNIKDTYDAIEDNCRKFLCFFGFKWGALTTFHIETNDSASAAAKEAVGNKYTYFALVLEMQHMVKINEDGARALIGGADLGKFQMELNKVIDNCNSYLREIEKMQLAPESRLASAIPVSPVGNRHAPVVDYFF